MIVKEFSKYLFRSSYLDYLRSYLQRRQILLLKILNALRTLKKSSTQFFQAYLFTNGKITALYCIVVYMTILHRSNAFQMFMLFSAVSKQKDFSLVALKVLLQFGWYLVTQKKNALKIALK